MCFSITAYTVFHCSELKHVGGRCCVVHTKLELCLFQSELLELVSELDMLPLVYLSGLSMQTKILDEVVLRLLGDSDHRVRQAASTALVASVQ